jgi:cyclophilin family peptidyl-prolyl cis-trans isomerase
MEGTIVMGQGANQPACLRRIFTVLLAPLAILGAALLPGCGSSSTNTTTETSTTGSSTATSTRPAAKRIDLEKPTVRIETSAGSITLELDGIRAPGTVRNFLNYADAGFYDNTIVHFVDPGKMIVAGGYAESGQPKPGNTPIRNEAHNGLKNTRGTIAMTRDPAQIDSATSQFFINLSDAPQRDHTGDTADHYGYCVFGRVTEGLDVADKISKAATADRGGDLAQTPDPAMIIKSVRVVR